MMSLSTLFLLIMASIGIAMCSALMNIPTQRIHSSISPRSYKLHIKHHPTLFAENRDDDEGSVTGSLESLISSFPSPNNVKENILEVRRCFLCITRFMHNKKDSASMILILTRIHQLMTLLVFQPRIIYYYYIGESWRKR